jgi:hypothetical protein
MLSNCPLPLSGRTSPSLLVPGPAPAAVSPAFVFSAWVTVPPTMLLLSTALTAPLPAAIFAYRPLACNRCPIRFPLLPPAHRAATVLRHHNTNTLAMTVSVIVEQMLQASGWNKKQSWGSSETCSTYHNNRQKTWMETSYARVRCVITRSVQRRDSR